MNLPRRALVLVLAPLVLSGCNRFGQAMTAHTDVLARAAGHELRIDEAARILAGNPQIPAEPQVVQALADLWVDYTLLATAAAEDTALGMVNLDRMLQPQREAMILRQLAARVLRPDTVITEEQLRQRWATDGPGGEIRARHILLRIPPDATPAQRDSVRRLAEQLRGQVAGGADFAALARRHSADPGSAAQGGDLGFFGRGRMVQPFEDAAFAAQPGQVTPVVESPFGFHVIRVEERRQPELGEQREEFRQYLVQRAGQEAEQTFVDSVAASSNLAVRPGAAAAVREIAAQPDARLRGRAGERALASYRGGELTAGEVADLIRQQPDLQAAIPQAQDEQLETMVKQMAHRELLLREASTRGVVVSPAETEAMRGSAREGIRGLLTNTGISGTRAPKGEARKAAVESQVKGIVTGAVAGTRQVPPLGPLSAALRDSYKPEVNTAAIPRVVSKVTELRAAQPAPPMGGQMPQQMPQQAPQQMPQPRPAAPQP